MRRFLAVVLAASAVAAGCGGKSTMPTSPTSAGTATVPGGGPKGFASIVGSVHGALPSSIAVVGTSLTAAVDASGHFALADVPAGDLQLQLSGGGANATLPVAGVQPAQSIDMVVAVAGGTASIESQVRTGGATDAELEGRVEALPPATAALSFKAAGRLVKTDAATQFVDGGAARSFSDLRIGMRVHVKGAPSGDAIAASRVELQNSQTAVPMELEGPVSGLTGSAAAFQFTVNGTLVKGDATTAFVGDGGKPDTFADLKNTLKVEVKGQQQNGFVQATRIHVETPETAPAPPSPAPPETSASLEGRLASIGGSSPNLSLMVNTTTVHTSSSTTVKRRGDVQTLATLAVGQTLHVIGTRRTDGSIDARQIEIEDDAAGGEFEIAGSMGGLKGTCPSLTFAVNGFSIATNAATTFDGAACPAFKNGDKVEVKGTRQADGSVRATRVKKED